MATVVRFGDRPILGDVSLVHPSCAINDGLDDALPHHVFNVKVDEIAQRASHRDGRQEHIEGQEVLPSKSARDNVAKPERSQ